MRAEMLTDLSIITFVLYDVRLFVNPSLRHFELVPDPTRVELGSWALRGWLLCPVQGVITKCSPYFLLFITNKRVE